MTDESLSVWIESVRDAQHKPICMVHWGDVKRYVPVDQVRDAAADMFSCAVLSEVMMKFISAGAPKEAVVTMVEEIMNDRVKRYFGIRGVLEMAPAGASERRQPLVVIWHGKGRDRTRPTDLRNLPDMAGSLKPDEARRMALHWMLVADGTDNDRAIELVLDQVLKARVLGGGGTGTPGVVVPAANDGQVQVLVDRHGFFETLIEARIALGQSDAPPEGGPARVVVAEAGD